MTDNMKKLITFGDSWVIGVGAGYQKGQTPTEYKAIAWSNIQSYPKSFRSLISKNYDLENINFSNGGSSNQRQFRKASEYFIKDERIDKDAVVLWGLTSVYRTEYFSTPKSDFVDVFLPTDNNAISKILAVKCFDEAIETDRLFYQIKLFNSFFSNMGIKNYWFNIFNEHKFPGKIDNLLFDGNSLLSYLVNDYNSNNQYHKSIWEDTDRKITRAKDDGIVNPYSLHPTQESHIKITDLFEKEINFKTGEKI